MNPIWLKFQEASLAHWKYLVSLLHNLSELLVNPFCSSQIKVTMGFLLHPPVHRIPLWFWLRVLTADSWGPQWLREAESFERQGGADAAQLSSPVSARWCKFMPRLTQSQHESEPRFPWPQLPPLFQIFPQKTLTLLPYQPHFPLLNPRCPLFLMISSRDPSQFTYNSYSC